MGELLLQIFMYRTPFRDSDTPLIHDLQILRARSVFARQDYVGKIDVRLGKIQIRQTFRGFLGGKDDVYPPFPGCFYHIIPGWQRNQLEPVVQFSFHETDIVKRQALVCTSVVHYLRRNDGDADAYVTIKRGQPLAFPRGENRLPGQCHPGQKAQ